jgi:hypothetical protein
MTAWSCSRASTSVVGHQELGDVSVGEPAHRCGASEVLELVWLQDSAVGRRNTKIRS